MIIATCWKFLGKYTGHISGRCTNLQKPRLWDICGVYQSLNLYLLRACFTLFVDLDFYDLSPE